MNGSCPRQTIYAKHTQQWTLVVPCSVDTIYTEISKPLFGMAASCTISNILSNRRIHDHNPTTSVPNLRAATCRFRNSNFLVTDGKKQFYRIQNWMQKRNPFPLMDKKKN
jgi:hypothetical protein